MKTYLIANMTCEGCTRALKKSVERALGPETATVQLHPGLLTVHCEHDPAVVSAAVEKAGYAIRPAEG